MGFKIIPHTADAGIEVWADSLAELFEESARGMFQLIAPEGVNPIHRVVIEVHGDTYEDLLHDWLAELLYRFEVDKQLFCKFKTVELTDKRYIGEAYGETYDPHRHVLELGIKAVTYHRLKIQGPPPNWRTDLIFDT